MLLNLAPFFVVDLAGFVQETPRDADLSNVVEQATSVQDVNLTSGDAQFTTNLDGHVRNAFRMAGRPRRFRVNRLCERFERAPMQLLQLADKSSIGKGHGYLIRHLTCLLFVFQCPLMARRMSQSEYRLGFSIEQNWN